MTKAFGNILRILRVASSMSQLELSVEAGVSTKHLSFLESGRSKPGRDVILKLCDVLKVSSTLKNALLLAGGFSPEFENTNFSDAKVISILERMTQNLNPDPAFSTDANGKILNANLGTKFLLRSLNGFPIDCEGKNIFEIAFGPSGFGPYLYNYEFLSMRFLTCKLMQDILSETEEVVSKIEKEAHFDDSDSTDLALQFEHKNGILSFDFLQLTVGHPFDVNAESLRVYHMVPRDSLTKDTMRQISETFLNSETYVTVSK